MPKKTVAIVGGHNKTREFAPWDRRYIKVWLFNEAMSIGWPKRCDAVFQMHHEAVWRNPMNRNDPKYAEWMKRKHRFPIYMQQVYEDVPSSVAYPLEQVRGGMTGLRRGRHSSADLAYFTSSISYALGLAIYQGYERIELYGVEMASDTEYQYQRDGVFLWLGLALGKGIEVVIHEESGLFTEPLYGYEGDIGIGTKQFEERLGLLSGLAVKAGKEAEAVRKGPVKEQAQALINLGLFEGGMQELKRYIERAQAMDEAAGKHQFYRQEFEFGAAAAQKELRNREAAMNLAAAQAQEAWKRFTAGKSAELEKEHQEAHTNYLQKVYEFGFVRGVMNENGALIDLCDELIKAAGGEKAVEMIREAEAGLLVSLSAGGEGEGI